MAYASFCTHAMRGSSMMSSSIALTLRLFFTMVHLLALCLFSVNCFLGRLSIAFALGVITLSWAPAVMCFWLSGSLVRKGWNKAPLHSNIFFHAVRYACFALLCWRTLGWFSQSVDASMTAVSCAPFLPLVFLTLEKSMVLQGTCNKKPHRLGALHKVKWGQRAKTLLSPRQKEKKNFSMDQKDCCCKENMGVICYHSHTFHWLITGYNPLYMAGKKSMCLIFVDSMWLLMQQPFARTHKHRVHW